MTDLARALLMSTRLLVQSFSRSFNPLLIAPAFVPLGNVRRHHPQPPRKPWPHGLPPDMAAPLLKSTNHFNCALPRLSRTLACVIVQNIELLGQSLNDLRIDAIGLRPLTIDLIRVCHRLRGFFKGNRHTNLVRTRLLAAVPKLPIPQP